MSFFMSPFKKNIHIIVACTSDFQQKSSTERLHGIGRDGIIPWKSSHDMQFFKDITTSSASSLKNLLIMGRKTFESLKKPLCNRIHYVLTSGSHSSQPQQQRDFNDGDAVYFFNDLETAILSGSSNPNVDKIFIIGGEQVYHKVLRDYMFLIENVHVTFVNGTLAATCDRFINMALLDFKFAPQKVVRFESAEPQIRLFTFHAVNMEEMQYLNLLQKILDYGDKRTDRTNVGTLSCFGERLEFDISIRIPFLTTKRLAHKTVLRELLWFVSGDTNAKHLQNNNVHIWDGNTSREFLDKRGLHALPEGDIGAGYGFQWRHFGAEYIDCNADYTGQGVDQIEQVVHLIKTDPTSRRIMFSAWNPAAMHKMALPPCHVLCQFYVRGGRYLDCQMYQRSADMALGVPFNIASYSMLTYMIAWITDLKPGKFTHVIGDAHIYTNHIDAVREQLARKPLVFPRLSFKRQLRNIGEFVEDDFVVTDYNSHPPIKMEMSV